MSHPIHQLSQIVSNKWFLAAILIIIALLCLTGTLEAWINHL